MAPSSSKGKEKVIGDGKGSGKRKRGFKDDDKSGGVKRRNRQALQFFEDAAYEVGDDEDDDSDDSFFDDGFLEDEFDTGNKFQKEPSRASFMPFVLKEEEPTEEELEKLLQERYKPGSSFVTHAEDNYESKKSIDIDEGWPSIKEPTIWKVKCVVGRERHSAFCLMQKYVDLKYLGNKLQIISAFSVDHIKGFIYVEADTQQHIYEACNGLSNIYSTRVAPVPRDDVSHLFTIRSMGINISEGMWARVKNGKYKGDLAQVAAVNDARKKVTVKLVPRIDMKALAEKIGRGTTANRAVTPAPRLIISSELEEFRPLIQFRRDRDTNKMFEVLDGMMLKDGYLYKKVSVDSLSFWGVTPKDDELLKFEPSKNDESKDLEFLSQLYGDRKKKRPLICDKGGGKGDGSSSSSVDNNFEVNDLVFFGRKDFGVIIGSEKDGFFKIIKEGSGGQVIVTLQKRDLKNALFDKKLFTALDLQAKNISINDTVRVVEGSLKAREGIVKRIYRGIIFLYNETVEENNGYFCTKAPMCEKVELPVETSNEKNGEPDPSGFGDFTSSPRSPLSPRQSDQARDGSRNFKREDDVMFSVGQSVRIRVGPLKGYLCRVLAIRRSDVTVKLHSHHRVLTVKCEHLSEVRPRTAGISLGEGSDSVKPFDLLGTQDGSTDWMDGASKAAEGGSWNVGGFSTERSSWPSFPASNSSLQPESESSIPLKAVDDDANKDASWDTKPTRSQGSSWGISAAAQGTSSESGQVDGWGNHEDGGKKGAFTTGSGSSASDGWGKAVESLNQATGKELEEHSWGRAAENLSIKDDSGGGKSTWDASGVVSAKPTLGWGNTGGSSDKTGTTPWNKTTTSDEGPTDGWATMKKDGEGTGVCGKGAETSAWNQNAGLSGGSSSWNKQDVETSCSKQGGGSSWNKPDGGSSSWRKQDGGQTVGLVSLKNDGEGTGAWGKGAETSAQSQNTGVTGGSSWNKQDAETVCVRQGCGSSWNKPEGGSSSWSKQDGGSSSWSKQVGGSSSWSKQGGGSSSWSKPEAGSSLWSKDDVAMENTGDIDQPRRWGRSESFNGGRGSGGRRGRGGGRGGRGQFGRERSFGQDETSSWTKSDQGDGGSKAGTLEGNNSGWGKNLTFNQDKVNDSWDKPNTSSVDGSKWAKGSGSNEGTSQWGGKSGNGWSDGQAKDQDGNKGCFGNESKLSDESCPSGWSKKSVSNGQNCDSKGQGDSWNKGGISTANQASGWGNKAIDSGREQSDWDNKFVTNASGDNQSSGWNTATSQEAGGGGWEKKETPAGSSKSAWETSTSSLDGNQSSAWGGKSDWVTQKASLDNTSGWDQKSAGSKMVVEVDKGGAWKNKNTSDGGSSSGWGQSKWDGGTDAGGGSSSGWGQSKWSGAADACGNENSWSNRNNWKSENNFGSSAEQIDKFDDRGGGGNWRGGRGGRWGQDRGGFRGGRGGSERGGFRGRGRSDGGDFGGRGRSDRGRGFGGRGRSDRGDFVGRGGSDGGGFRGRGGFGERGRGRRDDWNKNDSSEDNAPYSWNNTSNKDASRTSNASAGHWSGVVNTGKWQSGSSGWNASEGVSEGRNDTQGGGWNKGVGSSKDAGWSDTQGGGWKSTSNKDVGGSNDKSTGWNSKESNCKMSNSSGWNDSVGVAAGGNDTQGSGWNKGVGSSKDAGWSDDTQGSGWKNTSNKDVSGSDDKSNGWSNPAAGEATSSG